MRIVVDMDLCEGNGVCVKAAPTIFAVGDDDKAALLIDQPGEEHREVLELAVRRCPRQALAIVG